MGKDGEAAMRAMDAADHRGRGGFTLAEVLIAISLIALLTGLILGGASYMKASSEVSRTRLLLQQLKNLDIEYRAQSGYIVSFTEAENEEGQSIETFVEAVMGFDDIRDMLYAVGDAYLVEVDPDTTRVVDAWGKPLQYRAYMKEEAEAYPGAGNLPRHGTSKEPQPFFASAGPDGEFETEDDIYSFTLD
jgi:prepilin-type N-terminal cleavage/methylation domain-containing protein